MKEDLSLSPPEEAAVLLEFAKNGQETDGSNLSAFARMCYEKRNKNKLIFRTAAWMLCIMSFFQLPSWSYYCNCSNWDDQLVYPSSGIPYAPYPVYITFSALAIIILFMSIYLEYGYEGKKTDRAFLLHIFTVILIIKSIEIFIGFIALCMRTSLPIVSFSPIEALVVIFVERKYTSKIWYLALSLPSFAYLMMMLICGLCSYVVLGFLIFHPDSDEYHQYFNTFANALWTMFMVFTASNWPNPMMPAYDDNRLYFLYFFIFFIIFHWGLLNVLIGFVYTLFSQQKDNISDKLESIKKRNIELAYHVLDVDHRGFITYNQIIHMLEILYDKYEYGNLKPSVAELNDLVLQLNKYNRYDDEVVRVESFMMILRECSAHALRVYRSKTHFDRVFNQSSASSSFSVFRSFNSFNGLKMFSHSVFNNNIDPHPHHHDDDKKPSSDIPVVDRYSAKSRFIGHNMMHDDNISHDIPIPTASSKQRRPSLNFDPNKKFIFNMETLRSSSDISSFIKNLSLIFDTSSYTIIMDSIIFILGAVYITIAYQVQGLLISIFLMMLLECISKLVIKGRYRYRRSYRNYVDGLIMICLFISMIIAFSYRWNINDHDDADHDDRYYYSVRIIILIRVLIFFPRNLMDWEVLSSYRRKIRQAFEHALLQAGHFYFLLLVLLVFMYIFASIGVHAFGGKISYHNTSSSSSPSFASSDYAISGYYPLNFNDIPSGMATMFVLLHVNNMHVTASGFSSTTSDWAQLFFTAWYIIGVLFLLNILVAFFLNEFISSLRKTSAEASSMTSSSTAVTSSKTSSPNRYKAVITNRTLSNASVDHISPLSSSILSDAVIISSNKDIIPSSSSSSVMMNSPTIKIRPNSTFLSTPPPSSSSIMSWSNNNPISNNPNTPTSNNSNHRTTKTRRKSLLELATIPVDDDDSSSSDAFGASLFADTSNRRNLQLQIQQAYQVSKYGSSPHPQHQHHAINNVMNNNTSSNDSNISRPRSVSGDHHSDVMNTLHAHVADDDGKHDHHTNASSNDSPREDEMKSYTPFANIINNNDDKMMTSHDDEEGKSSSAANIIAYDDDAITAANIPTSAIDDQGIYSYEKAAAYIQLAIDGYDINILPTRRALLIFRTAARNYSVVRGAVVFLALLRYFERPTWTYSVADWDDRQVYPASDIPYLDAVTTISLSIPCLMIIIIFLSAELLYLDASSSMSSSSSYMKYMMVYGGTGMRWLLLSYAIIQVILYLAYLSHAPGLSSEAIIAMGVINEFYLLWFHRRSLEKLVLFLRLVPPVGLLIGALVLMILFFGIFGPFIYEDQRSQIDDDYDRLYFGSYEATLWSVFVAISSSSYPNQIMPAFRNNRAVFFYFFVFISLGSFAVLNFLLVIILIELQTGLQYNKDKKKARRHVFLLKAFEVLDINEPRGYIYKAQMKKLLDELFSYYHEFNKFNSTRSYADDIKNVMVDIMDIDEDGLISLEDFMFILEVSRVKLKGSHDIIDDNSRLSEPVADDHHHVSSSYTIINAMLDMMVRFYAWLYAPLVIDIIIIILIIISLTSTGNVFDASSTSTPLQAIIYILWMLDSMVVIYACKSMRKTRKLSGVVSSSGRLRIRHKIDIILATILSALYFILIIMSSLSYDMTSLSIAMRIVEAIRLLVSPRNFLLFLPKALVSSLVRILRGVIRSIFSMSIAFYCICYFFLVIGVNRYGGKITTASTDGNSYYEMLLGSLYASNGYWNLNFNDYPSGLVTLLCCLYVSNWDVIATGFSAVTSEASARVFFTAWYVIGVLLILNALTSFFLAGFVEGIKSSAIIHTPSSSAGDGEDNRSSSVNDNQQQHTSEKKPRRMSAGRETIAIIRTRMPSDHHTNTSNPSYSTDNGNNPIHHLNMPSSSVDEKESTTSSTHQHEIPASFSASMAHVKDLDGDSREKLRRRLQNLDVAVSPRPTGMMTRMFHSHAETDTDNNQHHNNT